MRLRNWPWAVAGLLVVFAAYLIGYSNSPGPYLPSEDSFDYTNHHCVPLNPEESGF